MSIAHSPKKSRNFRTRLAAVAAVGLGLATVPIALAAPAQAATSNYACVQTPLKPIFSGFNQNGTKLIDYRIQVHCSQARWVNIEQERWESDSWPNPDDFLGRTSFRRYLVPANGTVTLHNVRTLVDTEIGDEEVYQKTRHQEGFGGVWSPYTGWKQTAELSIAN